MSDNFQPNILHIDYLNQNPDLGTIIITISQISKKQIVNNCIFLVLSKDIDTLN